MPSLLERFRRGRPAGEAPVPHLAEAQESTEPQESAEAAESTERPATGSDGTPQAPAAPARRRPLPPAGLLRRERRTLLRDREERIRDLGGLVLEMYRQDRFRQDLVYEQAAEVVAIEERLFQVDQLLALATSRGRVAPAQACPQCGAPVFAGARFCASCGNALAAPQP